VLDADHRLDAYSGAYVALREELEVALLDAARTAATDAVMTEAIERMLLDKRRHVQFGWPYLSERRTALD
jgi:hypothetical protein